MDVNTSKGLRGFRIVMRRYRRLVLRFCIIESSSLADNSQWQFHYIILGVVISYIAISSKKIGSWYLAIIVEKLFSCLDLLDRSHDEKPFFLEKPGLGRQPLSVTGRLQIRR
jgi:hypothetical protein